MIYKIVVCLSHLNTITDNQEDQDLATGDTKTLNNVNRMMLWNDDEDESIRFGDNNFVKANINFFI